eukprot:680630-Amphidinium_carterae.2
MGVITREHIQGIQLYHWQNLWRYHDHGCGILSLETFLCNTTCCEGPSKTTSEAFSCLPDLTEHKACSASPPASNHLSSRRCLCQGPCTICGFEMDVA